MAELSYSCSVSQGFNFEKDQQPLVGHINTLKIGDQELKSDLQLTDPLDVSKVPLLTVFGVVNSIYWAGGYSDPVQFSCQVSTANKNLLATLQHKKLSNTEVIFSFTIYDYDPTAKKYYKCFHTDGKPLEGLIYKSGGSLAMNMYTEQSMEVPSPKNYTFALGVMPKDKDDMAIQVAISETDKFAKKWGVGVVASKK
ncbi:MAG: hypothetical protein AB1847_19005 [bacterium]